MYAHFLVPVDGSPHSDDAVREAARLARRTEARLTLLHVLPSLPAHAGDAAAAAKGRAVLERSAGLATDLYVRQLALEGGSPHETILRAAAREGCDVIVMGTRGCGGTAGALVGSETQKVLARATMPVLVIRGADARDGTGSR